MELSGRELAKPILENLKDRVQKLNSRGTIPELAIITVGGEDAWFSYVSQKQKTAQRLGIKTRIIHIEQDEEEKLLSTVQDLNDDPNIHGIIIQRPLPKHFNREKAVDIIAQEKDIDGFKTNSNYIIPIVLAVENFITHAYGVLPGSDLQKVLINQYITVVGKGETAGTPVIKWLDTLGLQIHIIDSKTKNIHEILQKSDLVISGVGKKDIIKKDFLKKGVVLIGIGLNKYDGKLVGDYHENEIKSIAKAYTPTPGGVGPLNLAYLFKNLLDAAEIQTA